MVEIYGHMKMIMYVFPFRGRLSFAMSLSIFFFTPDDDISKHRSGCGWGV